MPGLPAWAEAADPASNWTRRRFDVRWIKTSPVQGGTILITISAHPGAVEVVTAISTDEVHSSWPTATQIDRAGRRLAAATAAGALCGFLAGGIGGRLAMMLLARLSPETAGVRSDDDFVIGQLTLSGTLNLLAVVTFIGVLGGGIYLVARGLMIGPRWFQVLSISLGPAVVVGAMLVHPEGVDFTLLRPTWLAIGLFVAIPGLYAALLTVLAERWLRPDGRFLQAPRLVAVAPLILWLPLAPVLLVGVLGGVAVQLLRRQPGSRALLEHPWVPWLVRLSLVLIFAFSLTDLVRDVAALT